jgi:AcrR family transcriptional regulator
MATQPVDKAEDLSNRVRLLQAATDAFAEQGYEGASLRAIADNAGVSFQLISYYFGSKEDLWIATVDYLYERYLETGKGLGFTLSGNIYEQFHNHLRLLLTDMLQRPQLRKIWIQEHFAGGERYTKYIQPKIRHLHENLSLPYFTDVVRLGIVSKFAPREVALIWASVVQLNVVYPYYVELLFGVPTGSPKSIEIQVDLVFRILTESATSLIEETSSVPAALAAGADQSRLSRLEADNMQLKLLIGTLSLEKKALLDLLEQTRGAPENSGNSA